MYKHGNMIKWLQLCYSHYCEFGMQLCNKGLAGITVFVANKIYKKLTSSGVHWMTNTVLEISQRTQLVRRAT